MSIINVKQWFNNNTNDLIMFIFILLMYISLFKHILIVINSCTFFDFLIISLICGLIIFFIGFGLKFIGNFDYEPWSIDWMGNHLYIVGLIIMYISIL